MARTWRPCELDWDRIMSGSLFGGVYYKAIIALLVLQWPLFNYAVIIVQDSGNFGNYGASLVNCYVTNVAQIIWLILEHIQLGSPQLQS